MKRFAFVLLVSTAVLLPAAGCESLISLLQPNTVTVRLVNTSTSFQVDVELYYSNDQNVLEALLTTLGEERELSIPAGQSTTFSVDCDDLQAIMIEQAELVIISGIGPEESTGVYRDGTDFNCGDTLVFTFTHPVLPTDLDISFAVQGS